MSDTKRYDVNNDQNSTINLSTNRIEDTASIKNIVDDGNKTERNNTIQNLTDRSKESQDNENADLNQLQYLIELNHVFKIIITF